MESDIYRQAVHIFYSLEVL